jgi:hypothetical protein
MKLPAASPKVKPSGKFSSPDKELQRNSRVFGQKSRHPS